MDAGDARREFFAKQAGKRYRWAKSKTPAAVARFESSVRARRGYGKRAQA